MTVVIGTSVAVTVAAFWAAGGSAGVAAALQLILIAFVVIGLPLALLVGGAKVLRRGPRSRGLAAEVTGENAYRSILSATLIICVCVCAWAGYFVAEEEGVDPALRNLIFVGGGTALILLIAGNFMLDAWLRRTRGAGLAQGGPIAQGNTVLELPLLDVAALVPVVFDRIGVERIDQAAAGPNELVALTKWSVASWGERLSVQLHDSGPATSVTVTSTPVKQNSPLPAARSHGFHYGKGHKNVAQFLRMLQKLATSEQATTPMRRPLSLEDTL